MEACFNMFYCVCFFLKKIEMFCSKITLLKNSSDKRQTNTSLVLLSAVLLSEAVVGKSQVHTDKKLGYHSGIKSRSPCGREHNVFLEQRLVISS